MVKQSLICIILYICVYEITYIHNTYCLAKMYLARRTGSTTMSACPHLGGGMGKIDMRGIGKDLRGSLHYFRFAERRINNLGSGQAAEEAPNRLT